MFRYFINSAFGLFIIAIMFNCSGDNALVVETNPSIAAIRTTSYWNMKSGNRYYVEVVAQDQQGFDNIETVTLSIHNSDNQLKYEVLLYDDGAVVHTDDGDKMAIDGIFTNILLPEDIADNSGIYTFTALAQDRDGNSSRPQQLQVTFDRSSLPVIKKLSAPDTINSIYGQQYFFATVYDSNGLGNIKDVRFQIEEGAKEGVLQTYFMVNDGSSGDAVSNDSIFTYRIDSTFSIARKGDYKLTFTAENLFEQNSNPTIHNLFIVSDNPEITKIVMTDSLKRPQGSDIVTEMITLWVSDAQGTGDIDEVYFYSKKPDGDMANNGDPIPMKNEGNGMYEFLMQMSSSALIGSYEFTFTARDKTGNLSETVVKKLEVY